MTTGPQVRGGHYRCDAPIVLVSYADPARSAGRGRLGERSDPDAPESERGGRELSVRRPDRGVLVVAR
jgi:hypothetical protein